MTERYRFRRMYKRLPGWLSDDERSEGAPLLYSLGLLLDAFAERMRQSLEARFPKRTLTEDALAYLGRDRGIVRGRNESSERYAERLTAWRYPYGHRTRGNAWGLLSQFRAYFLEKVKVFTVDRRGSYFAIDVDGSQEYELDTGSFSGGNDQAVTNWSRFWIGFVAPAGWTYPEGVLGDADLWGGVLSEDSDYVLGIDGATYSDIQSLRSIARDWKPAGTTAEYMLLVLNDYSLYNMADYIVSPQTSWFEFGGYEVAYGNAQTLPIPV